MGTRRAGGRRAVAFLLAGTLVIAVGAVVGADGPATRATVDALDWLDGLRPSTPGDDPVAPPVPAPESAPLARSAPVPAATVKLPAPGTQVVTLGGDRVRTLAAGGVLDITPSTDAAEGTRLRVDVLDRAATAATGVSGPVFGIWGVGESIADLGGRAGLPVSVSVDYSGFAHAFGAGYADRLRVVALPGCALAAPRPAGCRADGVELPSRNDAGSSRLVADVADLGALAASGLAASGLAVGPTAAGAVLLAVTAGVSGETGTFAATPLSPSGDWQVAPGSGEFSWSYGVTVPEPPAGTTPDVGLTYSSGAIDGMISSRNTQGPRTGVGWSEFGSSFVERRYTSCVDTVGTGDLCWKSHNATISLNGRSSELTPVDSARTRWRLKDDPGWLVEHLHLSDSTNGDDNGEYWKVTTPDGVQYFFGLGTNPDTEAATGSVWTVPVLADHSGEPCRAGGDLVGACDQAWRWNLDRVVDPNQMTTTFFYFKATGRYRAVGGLGNHQQPYVRGGRLDRIEYGKPAGTDASVSAAGKVTFYGEYRCVHLNASCPAPTRTNGTLFPDVPNDLICVTECLVMTPTFFATDRYAAVRTEVRVAGAWRPVEQVNLIHGFWTNSDGEKKLYLNQIQRVGLAQVSLLALPVVQFWPQVLANRVDVNLAAGKKPMEHLRVGGIIDEYGHQTWVTYGQKSRCAASKAGPSVRWDLNTQDCFPQKVRDVWATFHKYLATRVDEADPTGGSPLMATTYAYEGDPAWHHDDDEFSAAADQSWSDWRGYGTTAITHGASRSRIRLFRGMHGDRLQTGGPRSVQVEPFDGAGFDAVPAVNDEPWLAGAALVEAQLGPAGDVWESSLHGYEVRITAQPGADPQDWAAWVGETAATEGVASAVNVFQQQRSLTTYNALFQPETVLEEGWLSQTGDERCTRTSYAVNESASLLVYPASVVALAGACSSTTELSRTETYYDGSTTLGAAPTRGNPTRQRVRLAAAQWVTTTDATYDPFGRVTRVTDAAGQLTETAYEATLAGGFPRTTVETDHAGAATHVTTTEWLPEYDVPVKLTDPNGNITTYGYDGLGRLLNVRQPTEQPFVTGKPASWEFSYSVSPTKSAPPVVRSRQLQSLAPVVFQDTWVLYDTALRQRHTQTLSPEPGKVIVSTTSYDDRGLVSDETTPQAVSGTPGQGFLPATYENRTRTLYDALGRVSRNAWFSGTTERWASVTTYTHDMTVVEQPDGRRARSQVDGLGRMVRAEEWDGTAWQATTYGYDLADRLTSVTDPVGNTIGYTYNMAGWRLSMDDPDAGQWQYGYDDAGRQTTMTDAKGGVTHTAYDQLGRATQRRVGSATGALLASWSYDAPGEKGLLDRSTRVTPQGSWVVDVAGYDPRGRPSGTTLTVPAGVPGLSGSYSVGYGYDAADHAVTTSYPAVGGLPAETVTTRYTALGLPERMTGTDEYVWTAGYDDRGRPSTLGIGPRPGGQPWLARTWSYDADQRLARLQTATNGAVTVDHQFGYDAVGMLKERTTQLGAESWRECFGFDARERLVEAYTVAVAGVTCATGQQGTGDQPYDHSYRYSSDGNLTQRIEGAATVAYAYPTGPGVDRPHAPTAAGADSYQWDANGSLVRRTVRGATDTLTWDAERRLASVTGPTGTDSFVYDADGARLLRTTAAGRSVYFAGHEVTANTNGSTVTATRGYGFADALVATRTSTGVDYLVTDQQGSVEASLPAGGALQTARAYAPYGQRRSGGEFDTDRGWIGQIEDDNTDLAYLNARYYDPSLARFISPDPLFDTASPQTINPYAYGLNNPVANTDPSGAKAKGGIGGAIAAAIAAVVRAAARVGAALAAAARTIVRAAAGAAAAAGKRAGKAAAVSKKGAAKRAAAARAKKSAALKARKASLAMTAMHRANPDPAFWRWVAKVGAKGAAKVAAHIKASNKANGTAQGFRSVGATSGSDPCVRRVRDPQCVIDGHVPVVVGQTSEESDWGTPYFSGGFWIPFTHIGGVVWARDLTVTVTQTRVLATYESANGNRLVRVDQIQRQYRQTQYQTWHNAGPPEMGVPINNEWSGATSPRYISDSAEIVGNWMFEVYPDGRVVEW